MAKSTQQRRNDLRKRLIDIAEARIANSGYDSLRARPLATDAGCSVGAIYNAFPDMRALTMHVNGRTFLRLGQQVGDAVKGMESAPPCERLIALSHAYLDFADNNFWLWSALFDPELTAEPDMPEWYLSALRDLFRNISGPVREIFPDMDHEDTNLMTRGLFSSVHGIVVLGLQQRVTGVPVEGIKRMITLILSNISKNQIS